MTGRESLRAALPGVPYAVPSLGYFHVRKLDLHNGSATVRDRMFETFDVVLRRDYEAVLDALRFIKQNAESWHGVPGESDGHAKALAVIARRASNVLEAGDFDAR